jgi:Fe2+ or Zn2+ uptake regulation protein
VLPILRSKVAFIENLIQSMEKPDSRALDLSCTSDRLEWIRREFNDKEFTARDVHTALQKAGCAVDVRTVNRDLRALNARGIGRNRYSL